MIDGAVSLCAKVKLVAIQEKQVLVSASRRSQTVIVILPSHHSLKCGNRSGDIPESWDQLAGSEMLGGLSVSITVYGVDYVGDTYSSLACGVLQSG